MSVSEELSFPFSTSRRNIRKGKKEPLKMSGLLKMHDFNECESLQGTLNLSLFKPNAVWRTNFRAPFTITARSSTVFFSQSSHNFGVICFCLFWVFFLILFLSHQTCPILTVSLILVTGKRMRILPRRKDFFP